MVSQSFNKQTYFNQMPRLPIQNEQIRAQRRRQIVEAALAKFAESGFQNASISEIAQAAGISKGLIYNYFKSKEDLLQAVIHSGLLPFIHAFDLNKDGNLTDEEFEYFIDQTFAVLKAKPSFWRLYFGILLQAEVVDLIRDSLTDLLKPHLETLVKYYERRGEADPLGKAMFFGAVFDGVAMNFVNSHEMYPLDQMKKFLIHALK